MTNENQYDINRLDTAVDAAAKIRQILQEPDNLRKSLGKSETEHVAQREAIRAPLMEFLIKAAPYSGIVNKPINYCIEFYATFSINISVKSEIMV